MSEELKTAFQRVKGDVIFLGREIGNIKSGLTGLKSEIKTLSSSIDSIKSDDLSMNNSISELKTFQQTDRQTDRHIEQIEQSLKTLSQSLISLENSNKYTQEQMNSIQKSLENLQKPQNSNVPTHNPTDLPTHSTYNPTFTQINPTHFQIPTDKMPFYGLKSQNIPISSGNDGVPTDRQANQQTDQQTLQHNSKFVLNTSNTFSEQPLPHFPQSLIPSSPSQNPAIIALQTTLTPQEKHKDQLLRASEILNSLDSLKREIRLKFKRLTSQEMLIFSLIYTSEESGELVDYKFLSSQSNLSESSIRDYVHKIVGKGIPIIKEKVNNKSILLHISPDLKKLSSLETIQRLREI